MERPGKSLGVSGEVGEDPFFKGVLSLTQASRPISPILVKRGFSMPLAFARVRAGAREINLQGSVPVPPQDFLSEETSFRVITPESLVIKEIREPGSPGLFYVPLQEVKTGETPHRYRERVSLDEVGAHRPVHEPLRRQGEILPFLTEVAWRCDSDKLIS